MDQYTQILTRMTEVLTPDDDQYEEKLLAIAAIFRCFGQALTSFLCDHGFRGDADQINEKVDFLKNKFKAADIPIPRDIKKCFCEDTKIRPDTEYQICFSFHLDVEGTRDFFRRFYFERAFDCHSIPEAVYYYCMRNKLSWQDARKIISRMPKAKTADIKTGREILYTGAIIEFIDGIKTSDELVIYINDHLEQFGYNHATATKHIQKLWEAISCEGGLAYKEGLLLDKTFNIAFVENDNSDDAYTIVTEKTDSTWRILAQIVGLDRRQTTQFGTNRTIKPLLENNALLPSLAAESFPDRNGIELILRGKHVSHERIRKTMILLEFYTYWANAAVAHNTALWERAENDAERCIDKINRYLIEAGYPELYPGNPYDWIFLWAVNDKQPLVTFRYYMLHLYAFKSDNQA
ncbi:MAG: hypothetical protein LUE23_11835 [Lachnospiraceae bacterium]|nr:hypothetical protein [Lachnospiraceae bacterium]